MALRDFITDLHQSLWQKGINYWYLTDIIIPRDSFPNSVRHYGTEWFNIDLNQTLWHPAVQLSVKIAPRDLIMISVRHYCTKDSVLTSVRHYSTEFWPLLDSYGIQDPVLSSDSDDSQYWPTFFLMNVFVALKGSNFWFYIYQTVSIWPLGAVTLLNRQ